jgi:hypothetical protein
MIEKRIKSKIKIYLALTFNVLGTVLLAAVLIAPFPFIFNYTFHMSLIIFAILIAFSSMIWLLFESVKYPRFKLL